ncbi:PqiC family protein [Akkermansiaceae bacterium]|nr:PqiC family protein [Akkermansiaceae bacterium]
MKSSFLAVASMLLCAAFTACSSSVEHKYYLLSPSGAAPAKQGVAIGVGPVITASYLDRPYLVFQSADNVLDVNENHEWAGELDEEFARVLSTNLGRKKNTGNLHIYPWKRESELDYQVVVDVKRFHGTNNGEAVLEASWRIYKLPGSRNISSNSVTLTEPLEKDGFESLAAAQSRLVDKLAEYIASSIR